MRLLHGQVLCLAESLFSSSQITVFSLCHWLAKEEAISLRTLSYKDTDPIPECSNLVISSNSKYLPKIPLPNTTILGSGVPTYELCWGVKNIQPIPRSVVDTHLSNHQSAKHLHKPFLLGTDGICDLFIALKHGKVMGQSLDWAML